MNVSVRGEFRHGGWSCFPDQGKRKAFAAAACVFAILLMGTSAFPARAAVPPDDRAAQELLRQQERDRDLRRQFERRPDARFDAGGKDTPAQLAEGESPCFIISEIRLDDPSGQLGGSAAAAELPDPATGRCLGSRGINQVMARIQNALIERGYVTTRVLAEAQDLSAGVLALRLVPGRLRAVRFSEDSG
ncbi:MAG: hypothetical protein LBE85_10880, partial [Candidatus Accumulibacter sp.]|nr:hypothetical protein [Accumulibacter sp.]